MKYCKFSILVLISFSFCYAQQSERSPYAGKYMYYFYSKSDEIQQKEATDKLGITAGKIYLLLGNDTVKFTQANDSCKLLRQVKDAKYIGRGIEDTWQIKGSNAYITFKEFIKP